MEMLFDRDDRTRNVQTFHYLDDTDRFVIQDTQDAEPIVEHVAALRSAGSQPTKSFLRYVGSIPLNVHQEMQLNGMIHDQPALRRWFLENNKLMYQKP